jgi:hypothetical protein
MYSGGDKIPRGHIPTSLLDQFHCPVRADDRKVYDRGPGCAGRKGSKTKSRLPLSGKHLNKCVPDGKQKDSFRYNVRKLPPQFARYQGLAGLRFFAPQIWAGIKARLKRAYPRTIPIRVYVKAVDEFMGKVRMGTPHLTVPWMKGVKLPLGYCRKEQSVSTRDGKDRTVKTVHAHGGKFPLKFVPKKGTRDEKKECWAKTGSHISIYRNCECAVKGGGRECENLTAESFEVYKPKAGFIKATLYIHSFTRKIKAIPEERGIAAPKGFRPMMFSELKGLLAQHDEKGTKLLIKHTAIKNPKKDIFRSEEDKDKAKFVIQMDNNSYLAYHSEFDPNVHKQVLPYGVYLTHKEALAVVTAINNDDGCKKTMLHVTPLNSLNFCFDPALVHTHEGGKKAYQYKFPNDVHVLEPIRAFLKKKAKKKGIKGLSDSRLNKLIKKFDTWLRGEDERRRQTKLQEKNHFFQVVATIASTLLQIGLGIGTVILFGLLMAPERTIPILKKVGGKIKAGILSPIRGLRAIGRAIQVHVFRKPLTEKQKAYLAERKLLKEQKKIPWLNDIKDVVQDGRDQVDIHKDNLRKNPDRIIIGREAETKEYILALKKSRFGHPALVGDSGSGKEMVLMSFSQRVAMAQLWEDDDFRKMVMKDYPEMVSEYEKADRMMDMDTLRYKRVFIADLTAMQADTSLRGQFATVLNNIKRAVNEGNSLVVFKELVDMLEAGSAGRMEEGQQHSESFAVMFKQMLEREGAHYGMDTLADRLLKMLRSSKFDDFIRRIKVVAVKVMSPKEILRVMQGRYVLGNFEDTYNVRFNEGAVEAATRLGIHFYGRSGPPMNAAYSTLEEAIQFAQEEATANGMDVKNTTLEITKEHIHRFLTIKKGREIDNPNELGKDTMELGSEHFTTREGMESLKALEEGIRAGSIRVPANERLVDSKLDLDEDIRVRKLALSIDTRHLGDYKNMPEDQIARLSVKYARRMLEILGDRNFGTDQKAWDAFVDNKLNNVKPLTKEQVGERPINNVLHWRIIQKMNPAKYDNVDTQVSVASTLADGFKKNLPALMAANEGLNQEQLMTAYVENYECNPILPRKIGSSEILSWHHEVWGTNPHEIVVGKEILKHMSAENLADYFGKDRLTAMRSMTERMTSMLNEIDGPIDLERFVAENVGSVRPWTISELQIAAQRLGITLDERILAATVRMDPSKYVGFERGDPAHLLRTAEAIAGLEVQYMSVDGQFQRLPTFEEKEELARLTTQPEFAPDEPTDPNRGRGSGGGRGGAASPARGGAAPSAPPAAGQPPAQEEGRSLLSHLSESERTAYNKIYRSLLNEDRTNKRAAQIRAMRLIQELRKGGEANVASIMSLSSTDIKALTMKGAVVSMDKDARPGNAGVRGVKDKDVTRPDHKRARGRGRLGQRGAKKSAVEFITPHTRRR